MSFKKTYLKFLYFKYYSVHQTPCEPELLTLELQKDLPKNGESLFFILFYWFLVICWKKTVWLA